MKDISQNAEEINYIWSICFWNFQ